MRGEPCRTKAPSGSVTRSAPTRIFAVPDDGLVTLQSSHDFATTLERLTAALESKGVRVFAQIDHAAGATSAGLELRPTTLVVFVGNVKSGLNAFCSNIVRASSVTNDGKRTRST